MKINERGESMLYSVFIYLPIQQPLKKRIISRCGTNTNKQQTKQQPLLRVGECKLSPGFNATKFLEILYNNGQACVDSSLLQGSPVELLKGLCHGSLVHFV